MMERFSSCRAFWSQRASVPLGSGETDMRKIVGLAFLATMFMVSACNTVEGMGKDVSSAGDTVAGTADDAKYGVCQKSAAAMLTPISGTRKTEASRRRTES